MSNVRTEVFNMTNLLGVDEHRLSTILNSPMIDMIGYKISVVRDLELGTSVDLIVDYVSRNVPRENISDNIRVIEPFYTSTSYNEQIDVPEVKVIKKHVVPDKGHNIFIVDYYIEIN